MNQIETNQPPQDISNSIPHRNGQYPHNPPQEQGQFQQTITPQNHLERSWQQSQRSLGGINRTPQNGLKTYNIIRNIYNKPSQEVSSQGGFDPNRFVQQPISEPTNKKEIKSSDGNIEEPPQNSIVKTFFELLKRQNINTDNSNTDNSNDSLETVISKVNTDRPGEFNKIEKKLVQALLINQ
jgi:hypothetical protein